MPAVPQTWWEKQGYKKDHAVHKGTEYYSRNTPADDFAGQVLEEQGDDIRGGDVRITVAPTRTTNPARPRTIGPWATTTRQTPSGWSSGRQARPGGRGLRLLRRHDRRVESHEALGASRASSSAGSCPSDEYVRIS